MVHYKYNNIYIYYRDELKRKAKLLTKEIREAKRQKLQDEADKQALEDSK